MMKYLLVILISFNLYSADKWAELGSDQIYQFTADILIVNESGIENRIYAGDTLRFVSKGNNFFPVVMKAKLEKCDKKFFSDIIILDWRGVEVGVSMNIDCFIYFIIDPVDWESESFLEGIR